MLEQHNDDQNGALERLEGKVDNLPNQIVLAVSRCQTVQNDRWRNVSSKVDEIPEKVQEKVDGVCERVDKKVNHLYAWLLGGLLSILATFLALFLSHTGGG